MKVYCTYCCKDKIKTDNKIPVIELYLSNRIKNVYNLSKLNNMDFIILSGKYGFLFPYTKIHYYDKLLQKNEVEILSDKLVEFVKKNNITEITFFYKSFEKDKNVINYFNAIKTLENKTKIKVYYKVYV